jgi:hypothetical protein
LIEKYEMHSREFGALRRSIRSIVARLSEGDDPDSHEFADSLRIRLSEWLTVPVLFDGAMLESVSALGDPKAVETRWGRETRAAYDAAFESAIAIQKVQNPVRTKLSDTVQRLRAVGRAWRIYCHKRARAHFETIFEGLPLQAGSFLYSVRDYRDAEPFDVLIKVGPLRSRGWGSAPDALISAPRFETLVQIVWSGCADEDGFGYDPVSALGSARDGDGRNRAISWTPEITHLGGSSADGEESAPELDELRFFQELARTSEKRSAILVQIDEENGILYPPHSQVAAFDPALGAEEPIGYRVAGETLSEGIFVIWPLLGTADLGTLHAGEGHYSGIWKQRLRDEFRHKPLDLMQRLSTGGIELRNLHSCLRQWCRPASTVIHAPQQSRHFEILIRVLGIDHEAPSSLRTLRHPWWQYAWSEIAHSRGEAIQTGMQEHEIIDEQLFLILNDLLPEIRSRATTQDVFDIEIPFDRSLRGAVRFLKVRFIEEGFIVPETILKEICELDTIEQWRV